MRRRCRAFCEYRSAVMTDIIFVTVDSGLRPSEWQKIAKMMMLCRKKIRQNGVYRLPSDLSV